jgi:hypothetical protein
LPRGKSGHIGEKFERKRVKVEHQREYLQLESDAKKMTFNNSRKSNKVIKSAAAVFYQ